MITWAYVAGFLDGEGTIAARARNVTLFQKDPTVLNAIREFLSGQGITAIIYVRKERVHNNLGYLAIQHQLRVSDKAHVAEFLWQVRPYVIVKKQLVEDVWRYLKIYPKMTNKMTGALSRITDKHVSRTRKGKEWIGHGNQYSSIQ